jgi:beta-N-acetylhexosaminidase
VSETVARQAAACLLAGFAGTRPPAWLRRQVARGLGGVVLFANNVESPEQVARLTRELREVREDVLVCVDEEGGDVTRLDAATGSSYPGHLALGAAADVGLTRQVASAIGADLAAVGINVDLAPVADVNTNPLNPVIGVRSFGSDPNRVSAHVAAFVEGLQRRRVAAVVKHFPGHGSTDVDSHLALPVVPDDTATLVRTALPPFRAAIAAGARAIMTAHISVPALDAGPATLSRRVISGLLREELGFDGVVVTDALEMRAISETVGVRRAAVMALAAGADALCVGRDLAGEEVVEGLAGALVEAVAAGRLPEERLAEAARRVHDLAAWAQRGAEARLPLDGPAAAREAARRAIRREGRVEIGAGPLVVELQTEPMVAVGDVPWGVGAAISRRDPETTVVRVDGPGQDVEAVLGAAAGRPLVLAFRDLHRHAREKAFADELTGRRPDAVLVEMGVPVSRPAGARAYLATHGASRVSAEAAAEVLLGGP